MYESHYCAWVRSAMSIFFVGFGRCLYVRVSGGSSFNETSCAISASVRTLKVPIMLMTIGIIMVSALSVACIYRACLVVRRCCKCGLLRLVCFHLLSICIQ